MKKWTKRTLLAVSVCILVAVAAASAYLIARDRNVDPWLVKATWSSISNVRVDFSSLVTNRNYNVGSAADPVKAELLLKEMYFHENDFVLPFTGRVSCSKGKFDCSMEIRAAVRFEPGEVNAGALRLGAFRSHGHNLGADEKFIAATLFGMVKDRIEIRSLEVDKAFKAVHSINNDFIEFEK